MMNWTFTWLRPDGPLSYEDMARVVARIFLQGVAGFAAQAGHPSAAAVEIALP